LQAFIIFLISKKALLKLKIKIMKKSVWIIIAIYIFLIYSTLPITRPILNFLYASLGQRFLSIIVNIIFVVITVFIIYFLRKKNKLKISFLFLLIILFLINKIERPEERIHFLEYGILGALIFKATGKGTKQNIFAIILLFIIAVIDELIQYILPNRVGDIRDIVMNLTGGVIGLWLGKFWYRS